MSVNIPKTRSIGALISFETLMLDMVLFLGSERPGRSTPALRAATVQIGRQPRRRAR
jgi:hypothetical protein